MADKVLDWPYPIDYALPADVGYSAQIIRAQHYSAVSGGNGVSSPTSMKVLAQPAPDGTVQILPGGADIVSTYAGQDRQAYYSHAFESESLAVRPTGSSSGGRTDLVIRRLMDPDFDMTSENPGPDLAPEEAADRSWHWYEVVEGATASTRLDFPHVKLAEISRPANTTIVTQDHITDLRVLSNPRTQREKYDQMVGSRTEVIRTGSWRTLAEVLVEVPDWATRAAVDVSLGGAYLRGAVGRGAFGMTGLGNPSSQGHTPWWENSGSVTNFRRIPYIQAGRTLNVGESFRGTTATIYIIGRVDQQSDSGFIFGADAGARAFVDVDWLQDVE